MKAVTLEKLFLKVNSLRRIPSRANRVGILREKIMKQVLQNMKKKGEIRDFLKTSGENTSWADMVKGIDFYVVKVGRTQYMVFTISVTGPDWIDTHFSRHPEVPVIAVDLKDRNVYKSVRNQLIQIFEKHSAH